MATDFSFILSNNASNGFFSNNDNDSNLLSNNNENTSSILMQTPDFYNGFDAFSGKDIFGSCDFSNLSEGFFANTGIAESAETVGSVAYDSAETVGSVACGTSEAAGSVACGAGSSCASFSDGGSFSSVC